MTDPGPPQTDWEDGYVESNGIDLHYVRTGGGGPPLVIAHGVFDDGLCRTPLARDLEDDYDVILYDARGHGQSDAPETGYDIETRVADLVGLIDGLNLENPYLFGHSMGGDTVAATAARHPDLPRAVAMEDPGGMLLYDDDDAEVEENTDEEGGSDPREWDVEAQIEWWHDHTKAELLEEDDELRGHVDACEEELASLLADARLRVSPTITAVFEHQGVDPTVEYPPITAPTVIIKADADEAGRERDRELAAHLPNGRLIHIEDTGHCVFRDDREAATRELREFLAENR